jgi:hypothetical protein
MAKISNFMIAMILSSLVITLLGLFVGSLNTYYAPGDYNESKLEAYNKLNDLSASTQQIQNQTLTIKEKTGILDVIGGYFSDGYQALRLTFSSYDTFGTMFNQALIDSNLGASGEYIRIALITIVLIIIIIGILISAIVKRDL